MAAGIDVAPTAGLLRNADRLEVHAVNCRNANLLRSDVIFTIDFVQDRRHLKVVVRFNIFGAAERTNFRREKVIHSRTRRPIHKIIRRVLVRPCRTAAIHLNDFENGVYPDEAVRKHGETAVLWVPRQFIGIDASSAIDCIVILVD